MKGLKDKFKKDLKTARERNKRELQNMKVSFPTYTIKCVTLYINSTN